MAPTVQGEFKRKRRMMWGLWDAMLAYGMLSPRGYSPGYMFEIVSHRLLRYLTPAPASDRVRPPTSPCSGEGTIYTVTFAAQVALLAAAALGRFVPLRPLRVAYYYLTDDRLDRSRALGPPSRGPCPDRLGEGGGNPMRPHRGLPRAPSWRSRRRPDPRLAPAACSRRSRSSSTPVARCSIASRGWVWAARCSSCSSSGRCSRAPIRSGVGTAVDRRRPPGDPDGPDPAALLARRAAQPVQRPPRRDGDRQARGRRFPLRPSSTRSASAGASSSAPASPAGRR